MKTAFRLLVTILLITGWTLAALALHVVYAPGNPGRLAVIPKERLGITDTWCDTRQWKAEDLPQHSTVIARLVETGKGDILSHVGDAKDLDRAVEDAAENGRGGKQTTSTGKASFFHFRGR